MLCIETICVENRELKNLAYHEARLNRTRQELWGYQDRWDLSEMLEIPDFVDDSIHKCRVAYDLKIDNIKWEPHVGRQITKLRRVYHNSVDYSYKYDQREELNTLFAQREDADEILIIKNGWVTDAYYYNVAFSDGTGWYTPTTYLLPGTQRAFLLDQGIIQEREISETDIFTFDSVKLFNALVNWEKAPVIDVRMID
ncbi:aminotransferase class IV [Dyadobacter sp. CY343]|uniref:aminotransferase class IV n=1 Tax=Dyadobacter sp. CY343 TaxID=2907299 RepID=UPI001F43F914|nr:aminotransferase class IV [Dyadobacter sp. CY343]MCE7063534.1 aminotransferase class IV [Dyadobacter sp. CY343]